MSDHEKRSLADRIRASVAVTKMTLTEIAEAVGVDQPFVSKCINNRDYQFETPKVARLINYVNMLEGQIGSRQTALPFDTTVAIERFLTSNGDLQLLNGLLDVLASRGAR